MKNYYKILRLEPFSSIEKVKSAYRDLALKYHPDHNNNGVFYNEYFLDIKEAYEFLSNPQNKEKYDAIWRENPEYIEVTDLARFNFNSELPKNKSKSLIIWVPLIVVFSALIIICAFYFGYKSISENRAVSQSIENGKIDVTHNKNQIDSSQGNDSSVNQVLIGSKPEVKKDRTFKCSTFVFNLTAGNYGWKDFCCNVVQGEPYDLNQFIYDDWRKKKENEGFKFSISVIDNKKKTQLSYTASFWLYEETEYLRQYHNIHGSHDIKAIIFDKVHGCWQILIYQNYEYELLSCYAGSRYINAFDI